MLQTPAVVLLLIWMLVPLSMTLYFSFIRYVLNSLRRPEWTKPASRNWYGFGNYEYVLNAKDFWFAIQNSVFFVASILVITVILGLGVAVMIQWIFHLALCAGIEIVSRGRGNKNLPYLIGEFTNNNIGAASATGIFAVILANIIAIFLLRMVGKSLMD